MIWCKSVPFDHFQDINDSHYLYTLYFYLFLVRIHLDNSLFPQLSKVMVTCMMQRNLASEAECHAAIFLRD